MISVRLEIKSSKLLRRFQEIIGSLEGVFLKESQEPGFPDVIIMEVESEDNFEGIESMQHSPSCPKFFLTSSFTSSEFLMRAIKIGIREFFLEPIKKEEVEIAFVRFKERPELEKPKKARYGKILSVLGSKGGTGSTTVAVNLAVGLAQSGEAVSVALVDLNLQFGDIPLFLDVKPIHTIAQISQNISRLDQVFLMDTLTRHPSGIYLLPPPNNPEEMEAITPDTVKRTLDMMREMFDYIVIDASRSLDQITLSVLDLSETIFLVTQLDLPALRNAKRFRDLYLSLGYDESKTKLIINRYEKRLDVSLQEAEKALGQKAFWLLPNDYLPVISSINQGKSVILTAHSSKVTKSFKELALNIQGKRPAKRERRIFGWRIR